MTHKFIQLKRHPLRFHSALPVSRKKRVVICTAPSAGGQTVPRDPGAQLPLTLSRDLTRAHPRSGYAREEKKCRAAPRISASYVRIKTYKMRISKSHPVERLSVLQRERESARSEGERERDRVRRESGHFSRAGK